ncbi:MAG: restriction endonuclease subunit S, partial [Candidatus Thiodiazotropha sp. (ex Lucinoma kastoroae)]|nr:restriction endonuclease subunit S [Candidatus Thiodiazotropha sp. (ex Lucinoma kastoroae)]
MMTVGWQKEHIGRSLKLLSGFPFPSKNFSNTVGFPLIRIRDITESKIGTYFQGSFISSYVIRKGDVLIGMDGDFNIAKWKNEDALLNQRVLKIDIQDPHKLNLNFIYYWLQPYIKKVNDITAATTVKHLSVKDLEKAEDKIPEVLVQRKIGKILQTIDEAIDKTEELIEKYKQIKAGLMHDLFTRGITADGKLRPPREQASELYQETPVGWMPKDWQYGELKGFVRSAQYGISTTLSDFDVGISVLRMNNIQSNMFDVTDLKYTNDIEAYRIKLKSGDVLYNRTNSMEHVGKTAIWRNELDSCSFASYLVRINLHEDMLLSEYFSHWMSLDSSQIALRRYATPAVQQVNINPTNLQKITISCPIDLAEQKLIVARLDSLDDKLNKE